MRRICIPASFASLAFALALAGCSTAHLPPPEPIIRTVEVQVPVDNPECPRKALAELGNPAYPDTDDALRMAADLFERVKLLLAGRELREAREAVVIGALAECAR